eukprot:7166649-Prymnesium_polylepis.1
MQRVAGQLRPAAPVGSAGWRARAASAAPASPHCALPFSLLSSATPHGGGRCFANRSFVT